MKLSLQIFPWLLALIFPFTSNSQEYRPLFDSIYANYPKAECEYIFDSLVLTTAKTEGLEIAAKKAHDFSYKYYRIGEYQIAIKYGQQEISYYEQLELKDKTYARALYQVGFLNEQRSNFNNAISLYQQIIDLNIDSVRVARSYGRIGLCYFKLGDFYKSITFYQKGTYLLEKLKEDKFLIGQLLDMTTAYARINEVSAKEAQLELLQKVEKLAKLVPLSNQRVILFHNNFASYYNSEEKYDFNKANYHYKKMLQIALSRKNNISINSVYVNLGILYTKEEKDSALWFLKESMFYPSDSSNLIKAYRAISDYYFFKKEYSEALNYINKALAVNFSTKADSVDQLGYELFYNCLNPDEALSGLIKKVNILIKQETFEKDTNGIKRALNFLNIADSLMNTVQNKSTTKGSKFQWRIRATDVYTKGILCANLLGKNALAFSYSEKIKSLLLIESIISSTKKRDLPDAVKEKELSLKNNVLQRERDLRLIEDEVKKKKYNHQLVNSKLIYQAFLDSLQHLYPDFYANNIHVKLTDLTQVQSQLDNNTVVVSFVWDIDDDNYDHIYLLLITKKECEIHIIDKAAELEKLIADFHNVVTKPFETVLEKDKYMSVAHQLYLHLFPTNAIRKQLENKKLLILPDHKLHSIPFEALVTDQSKNEYLIRKCEISYAYSMSCLFHNEKISRNPTKQLIAFSPVSFKNDQLAPLKESETEVLQIKEMFDSKTLLYQSASKTTFFKESGDYKFIHLATHAQAGENPWVAFSDGKMDITELYTFRNQAEMVVLSACNTSLGQIAKGEGVLSLTRGFFYSGANSIVATLWNVDDKSASDIISNFYKNLQEGETKLTALHKAKLNFLDTHSLSEVSPYYWASYTLMGNTNPVTSLSTSNNLEWLLAGLIVIIILLTSIFFYRKKKN